MRRNPFYLKNFPNAISDFTQAIRANPHLTTAYGGRAFAYQAIGDHKQAIEDWKIAATMGDSVSQKMLKEKGVDWSSASIVNPVREPLRAQGGDRTTEVESATVRSGFDQEIQHSDFSIKLGGCRFVSRSILCDVVITNKGPDRVLGISNDVYVLREWLLKSIKTIPTRIFDDIGNEYQATAIQFGGKKDKMPKTSLVQNIPARAVLTFDSVSPEPQRLPLLEIGFFDAGDNSFKIQFKNIPLQERQSYYNPVDVPLNIAGKYKLKNYKIQSSNGSVLTEDDVKMSAELEISHSTLKTVITFGNKTTHWEGDIVNQNKTAYSDPNWPPNMIEIGRPL